MALDYAGVTAVPPESQWTGGGRMLVAVFLKGSTEDTAAQEHTIAAITQAMFGAWKEPRAPTPAAPARLGCKKCQKSVPHRHFWGLDNRTYMLRMGNNLLFVLCSPAITPAPKCWHVGMAWTICVAWTATRCSKPKTWRPSSRPTMKTTSQPRNLPVLFPV
jgi:hypothetical protein